MTKCGFSHTTITRTEPIEKRATHTLGGIHTTNRTGRQMRRLEIIFNCLMLIYYVHSSLICPLPRHRHAHCSCVDWALPMFPNVASQFSIEIIHLAPRCFDFCRGITVSSTQKS